MAEDRLSRLSPLEHTGIGGLAGIVEVCIMQPTVAVKNALQEGRPLPAHPTAYYRGLLVRELLVLVQLNLCCFAETSTEASPTRTAGQRRFNSTHHSNTVWHASSYRGSHTGFYWLGVIKGGTNSCRSRGRSDVLFSRLPS